MERPDNIPTAVWEMAKLRANRYLSRAVAVFGEGKTEEFYYKRALTYLSCDAKDNNNGIR